MKKFIKLKTCLLKKNFNVFTIEISKYLYRHFIVDVLENDWLVENY